MEKFKTLYFEYLKGLGRSHNAIVIVRGYLKRFYRCLKEKDIREVVENDIIRFVKYLYNIKSQYGKPLKPSSVEHNLSILKGFFEYLYLNEYILYNPMENFPVKQPGIKKEKAIFSIDEINFFLDSIEPENPDMERDRAIFELLYASALRANEVFNLSTENIDLETRILLVKLGKGKKDRFVPFSEVALKFILKYLNNGRKEHLRLLGNVCEGKYLFLSSKGKVTHFMINVRLKKYLANCELEKRGFTLHSFRHTSATHLLESGASIRYVQELLGHECINTTQIYARPGIENIKKMYKSYHPRENEYYEEIDSQYLENIRLLKEKLIKKKEEIRKRRIKSKIKLR